MSYINEPKTNQDFEYNIQFQLENLIDLVSLKKYKSALFRAECLVDNLQDLINSK